MRRSILFNGIAAAAFAAALLAAAGCSHQQASSGSGWTPAQVSAFRGAPPPAEAAREDALAMANARKHPPKMAPGFSPIAPSPMTAKH